ncbi:hypothetical protein C8R45DRAFT_933317 [Mycena sanguinolenta]|nr:hypothetical protein C8R45DRAFT_933317 [Mycena sanguinolenta]
MYTVAVANALHDIATAAQIPLSTEFHKYRCLRIVDHIHHFLCVLINLSMHSEDFQSPKMLDQIGQYAVTLQKINSCLRAQQELGTIKRLFKQSELITQLDNCETELNAALQDFLIEQTAGIVSAFTKFNMDTETRHQELLELMSACSGSIETMSSFDGYNMSDWTKFFEFQFGLILITAGIS